MLNRITLPDYIKEIVIISDTALALRQLHKARPEPGHNITVQWHLAMNTFMNSHPGIRLAICWGPSKSSHSLVLADELAKLSRTTGVSPLVSLRTQRMNLRNNSLQKWRDIVHKGNQVDTPTRMSATYPRPNREPPYWLSLPRNLQARVCQLWSGRAVTQKFLSVINRENFEANCPFDDGVGMLTHYLYNCKTTANWRLVVASNTRDCNVPSLKDFGEKYIHYILQLVDHTALGSHSFSKEKGRSFPNP